MPIAYTRLYGLGALPKIIRQECGPEKYLELLDEARFSEESLRVRGKVVPHAALLKLFSLADKALTKPQQKIAVACGTAVRDFGPWAVYALDGADVGELISRAGKTVYLHQNLGRLSLDRMGGNARWSYWIEGVAPVPLHIEHALVPMIEAIRSYCGKSWKPLRLELQYRDRRRQEMLEDFLQVPVWMNQSVNSILFPFQDLACKRDAAAAAAQPLSLALLERSRRDIANATWEAVKSAVRSNIAHQRFDIDTLSKALGMSTRSLQRELNAHGLNLSYG